LSLVKGANTQSVLAFIAVGLVDWRAATGMDRGPPAGTSQPLYERSWRVSAERSRSGVWLAL
jgi:hypothetical protein